MQTILVCDDDKQIVEAIDIYLTGEGFKVIKTYDGYEALEYLETQSADLLILDVMMPGLDGIRTTLKVRETSSIPIIILSAKSEDADKILGLNIGADDYITKPFSVRELMARVKANLRKAELSGKSSSSATTDNKLEENMITVGELSLDLNKFEVRVRGEVMDLTLREFEVIKYLASQPGQVVTREVLLEKVWGYEYYGDIRTVDVTVRRIREKIEKDTSNPKILITKRGVGYYIASK